MFQETLTLLQDRNPNTTWLRLIPNESDYQRHGTMRKWMEDHNGTDIHTVQVDTKKDVPNAWCPSDRTVDATRAGSVRLNGSTRDYAGMKVLHQDPNVLVVADTWHTIAYVATQHLES